MGSGATAASWVTPWASRWHSEMASFWTLRSPACKKDREDVSRRPMGSRASREDGVALSVR